MRVSWVLLCVRVCVGVWVCVCVCLWVSGRVPCVRVFVFVVKVYSLVALGRKLTLKPITSKHSKVELT